MNGKTFYRVATMVEKKHNAQERSIEIKFPEFHLRVSPETEIYEDFESVVAFSINLYFALWIFYQGLNRKQAILHD